MGLFFFLTLNGPFQCYGSPFHCELSSSSEHAASTPVGKKKKKHTQSCIANCSEPSELGASAGGGVTLVCAGSGSSLGSRRRTAQPWMLFLLQGSLLSHGRCFFSRGARLVGEWARAGGRREVTEAPWRGVDELVRQFLRDQLIPDLRGICLCGPWRSWVTPDQTPGEGGWLRPVPPCPSN